MKAIDRKLEAIADRADDIADRMETAKRYADSALTSLKPMSVSRVRADDKQA